MNDKKLQTLAKKLSFFDFNETTHFKHKLIGYNLVLSGLQGALGCTQVQKFNLLLSQRKKVFSWYRDYLKDNKKVHIVSGMAHQQPNYWFPAIIFHTYNDKLKMRLFLGKKRVETRDFFIPIHQQPVYKNIFEKEKYPHADYFAQYGLLLPSYYELTKENVQYICKLINLT